MALIRSLEPGDYDARPPRAAVDWLYSIVYTDAGTKLLRLATLGSDQRKIHPRPRQIIELDEAMAARLLLLIRDTFPKLRDIS